MRDAEIGTWSRWALPATVLEVKRCARVARDDWRRRARDPQEALDARAFCTPIACEAAAHAAGRAAIEVAIIQHLWPGRLDAVLRPSLRWTG
jgi:hypothetical protein